jgi:RNA polymerase sigma-70 factor (ECF subfamily)
MLGNAVEAEDASQEAFLRAYTHLRSYDPERPFRSWLLSITSHYCIDRLRRRRINWLSLEEEIAVPEQPTNSNPNPEAVTTQHEREAQIQQMLAALSPTDRAAITLRYWYDCSYNEIAEMLGLTVSAVKSRLHRARRALAEKITENANTHADSRADEGEIDYAMLPCQ